MEIKEFIDKCVERGYSWQEGDLEGIKGYFVGCEALDTAAHFIPGAIEGNDWNTLEKEIIQGKKVRHVTRIVGYYSRIENWNRSKHGELKDRHKGDYKVI